VGTGERILEKGKVPQGGARGGDGTRAAEGAIPFGCAVELGTTKAEQVKKFAGGTPWGIAIYDPSKGYDVDSSGNTTITRQYLDTDPVSVLTHGNIVVEVEEAVDVGDPVYVDDTTANFHKSAGAGKTLLPNARFETAAAADGDLAEVRINLPG